MGRYKIAFYDAKSYDRESFKKCLDKRNLSEQFEFHFIEQRLSSETVDFATGCHAVCVFVNDDLSTEILAALEEVDVKLILMRCAGFDRVDLEACQELGISVVRVPAYSPNAVAEFAAALLLTLNRNIHKAYNRVRDGNFTLSGLVGFDLVDKTVGVIGTGKIGHCFVKIALGFGCKVLAYDPFVNQAVANLENVTYTTLDTIFSESDVISLHLPLTPKSVHLINNSAINKMKTGVYIINTSRGQLIDSKALVNGLVSGKIGGAGLDVYEGESNYFFRDASDEEIEDDVLARLVNMRNVLITSHQGFLTREALDSIANTTVTNMEEFFLQKKSMEALTNFVAVPEPPLVKCLTRRMSSKESRARAGSTANSNHELDV